ncbi:MAG TPA: alpha/beta hydrolase [Trueperaceae bacterium]
MTPADTSKARLQESWPHVYEPGRDTSFTVLALHGTGGNEHDLVPLVRALAPGAAILSPRGRVTEHGMPRYFRRLAEGVFDEADLRARTHELATFITVAAATYDFQPSKLVALGFSNGANIATSLLLLHPDALAGAALLRPMIPFTPDELPDLSTKDLLLSAGRHDPLVSAGEVEKLARLLEDARARVTLAWQEAGHGLVEGELPVIGRWLGGFAEVES